MSIKNANPSYGDTVEFETPDEMAKAIIDCGYELPEDGPKEGRDYDVISQYLSKIGKKGGSVKSAAKAQASAENGKKGGRPKKPVSVSAFNTVARGNGVPCNGDLFTGRYNGKTYRAEFYLEDNFGRPQAALAADSIIEKKTRAGWVAVDFGDDDDLFNAVVNAICPRVV